MQQAMIRSDRSVFRIRGEALDELRRQHELITDDQLADFIGMHRSAVYRATHGTARPGARLVAALVSAFDVRIDDLFEVVDEDQGATT